MFIHHPLIASVFLVIMNNAAIKTGIQISLQDSAFNSFRYIPINRIARSYGNLVILIFIFYFRNCHMVFRNSYTILHFYQEWARIIICPHSTNTC